MITKSYDTLPQCAKDIRINVFINEQGFQEEFDELDGISNTLSPLTAISLAQLLGFMSKTVFIISAGLPF